MKHLKKFLALESFTEPRPVLGTVAQEGISDWMKKLTEFLVGKPSQAKPEPKSEPENKDALRDPRRTKEKIVEFIQSTYLNDQWLDKKTEVSAEIALTGSLGILAVNGKAPENLVSQLNAYVTAIDEFITAVRPDCLEFYDDVNNMCMAIEANPEPLAFHGWKTHLEGMTYPLDRWMPKAPNRKTHVGGLEFHVGGGDYYERNHYSFKINTASTGKIQSLTKDQVKQVAKFMIRAMGEILKGTEPGMFDRLSRGMYFKSIDVRDLYEGKEGADLISEWSIYDFERILDLLQDKRDINWSTITVPYVTSLDQVVLALDDLINRSLK